MKLTIIALTLVLATFSNPVEAQVQSTTSSLGTDASLETVPLDHSHSAWTEFLKRYVSKGKVDYTGIHANGRQALDAYLSELESVTKSQYQGWTKKQKMAFGINAYNAYTIRIVLNNYPAQSMQKIGSAPGAVWKDRFIPLDKIWGAKISLGQLENDILRANFKDSRIHFALVCASISCPALRPEAYRSQELDKQLDDQTTRFLNDKSKNRFDMQSSKLYLSKIFEWYREDFTSEVGSVENYAAKYMQGDLVVSIAQGNVEVEYLPYDWSLNGK